jgi:hypothetical protein
MDPWSVDYIPVVASAKLRDYAILAATLAERLPTLWCSLC